MSQADVLIVGGGISGLSLAWWLSQSGIKVEVWEAAEHPGGKILSQQHEGYLTEQAAAMIMNFKPEVATLIKQANLESKKTRRTPTAEAQRYLLHQGQLTALPMKPGPLLFSPIWSLRGKLRLLAEPFIPMGKHLDESVSQFIARRLGSEMLEKAIEPFVAGTLAADPDQGSAAAMLPRLKALEKRYGSITAGIIAHRLLRRRTACVTDTFSFQGGMSTLIETLSQSPGITLCTGYKVDQIESKQDGWHIRAQHKGGECRRHVPQLVLATPAPIAARLVSPMNQELDNLLNEIQYAAVSVVHLGFNRHAIHHPLDGTGFLTPRKAGYKLTGNLWMSSLFADRAPENKALLTAYLGGARAPEVAQWTEDQTITEALDTLQTLIGIKGDPEMVQIKKHLHALPLYHGDYMARIQAIQDHLTKLPGLYLEANYHGGVSIRDRLTRSHSVANKIVAKHQQLTGKSLIWSPRDLLTPATSILKSA